jgi:ubiquinone/menaquinone biosynthesis C-methylase UbiE
MKWFYEITYRYFHAPWDIGPRDELVALIESNRLQPGRAIDLGCGTGANAIFLAQHGFEVTAVDFAEAAITNALKRAKEADVQVNFVTDDLTNLKKVDGTFDFLLDYGVLDDLRLPQRELYVQNMLPLTHPGSHYLLWGFEYPMRWWERFIPFYDIAFETGEIDQRFGRYFNIEKIVGQVNWSSWPPGYAAYWMTRK